MKNFFKGLAGSIGATALAAVIFGGSQSSASNVEKPLSPSFQQPTKRLILDYGQSVSAQVGQQNLGHESHASHASHASHVSGR
jgi:hypothetical protein